MNKEGDRAYAPGQKLEGTSDSLPEDSEMKQWYADDLAFVHDEGFAGHAIKSAPGLLGILGRAGIDGGLVVDLGCGSGVWASELIRAGYRVLGIDISEPMIRIARKRAPSAEFRVSSLFKTKIPRCSAVTSIGECLNYMFEPTPGATEIRRLFSQVHQALEPGGIFIFDIAEPGQVQTNGKSKGFTEGNDWIVLVEKDEDQRRSVLTRRIITLRKVGEHYRRLEEVHRQRLFKAPDIAAQLRGSGFRVRTVRKFGNYPLPSRHAAFIASKVK
jgi:SAM-dependent methyltransferase